MSPTSVSLVLSPSGHLRLEVDPGGAIQVEDATAARLLSAFAQGTGPGLLQLGAGEVETLLDATLAYWRTFASAYLAAVCSHVVPDSPDSPLPTPAIDAAEIARYALSAPPMPGGEYIGSSTLSALWESIGHALREEVGPTVARLQPWLHARHPSWNVVGRVHFHLAENRRDEDHPFAFLATYTTGISAGAKPQHVPLGTALREFAGPGGRKQLLSLLVPVQRAAESCDWLRKLVDSKEIFSPLRWSPAEALRMLRAAPQLESAGIVVRLPAAWRSGRPPRAAATASIGKSPGAGIGLDAMLDFHIGVQVEGEPLTQEEIDSILSATSGLVHLRGRWVEIDPERLRESIDRFSRIQAVARDAGISFREAARLLAGASRPDAAAASNERDAWSEVVAGDWLRERLDALRRPEQLDPIELGELLRARLRPYQELGVRWLHLLSRLGLGACLADDMGLGKTIQVLALLLALRRDAPGNKPATLIVAPASLLANWAAESARFTPSLVARVAHSSAISAAELERLGAGTLQGIDLVITTYAAVARMAWLRERLWDLVVLDEAQAIKNPGAGQTRAVKTLRARARIALTGTPVENRLGDLWSIFDFINPGLLGSAKQFQSFAKSLATGTTSEGPRSGYAPLRSLVQPYILRRLKTDRSIIADLPEKTEIVAWCKLSRTQAALYQRAVSELESALESADGIQRRGIILSWILRFKQICNHPSHWLRDDVWDESESGKFARLREIAETVVARQERMLVFSQFREVIDPLLRFLTAVCGRPGLVLHGDTAIAERQRLVQRFQEQEEIPFFVLSLKAGGTGLNLTGASHVVHFDRWWNPAVENQATDRAFRIGQTRNVLVHKLTCLGTIESRIHELIEAKTRLASEVLATEGELNLTEMSNEELVRLVALDVNAAREER